MKGSSGRKFRRAILKPWRARKQQVQQARKQAAFDLKLREKVLRALREQKPTVWENLTKRVTKRTAKRADRRKGRVA